MPNTIITPELLQAKQFHGHLGPYLVVGMRMGQVFCEQLGDKPFSYRIFTSVGWKPPLSCVIDGLQLSTPGTVGNSMIQVDGEGIVSAWTKKDEVTLKISLQDDLRIRIDTTTTKENEEEFAVELWATPTKDLFIVERTSA